MRDRAPGPVPPQETEERGRAAAGAEGLGTQALGPARRLGSSPCPSFQCPGCEGNAHSTGSPSLPSTTQSPLAPSRGEIQEQTGQFTQKHLKGTAHPLTPAACAALLQAQAPACKLSSRLHIETCDELSHLGIRRHFEGPLVSMRGQPPSPQPGPLFGGHGHAVHAHITCGAWNVCLLPLRQVSGACSNPQTRVPGGQLTCVPQSQNK